MSTKIVSFELHKDRTLTVSFDSGESGMVDLKGYLAIGGVYADLNDDGFFLKGRLARTRRSICWPGGDVELGADALLEDVLIANSGGKTRRPEESLVG